MHSAKLKLAGKRLRSALPLFLPLMLALSAARVAGEPGAAGQSIFVPQAVKRLPGQLDRVPVLNSNSPEVVQTPGILVSTLPPDGLDNASAHLNFPFKGRFDIFAHHISRADNPGDLKTLYLGLLLFNRTDRPVKVDVLSAASYLSQPDAPFIALPDYVDNPEGTVYAGPGDRVMTDILLGRRQSGWPCSLTIAPHSSAVLANLPIPVQQLTPPLNGRSLLARLRSSGAVYAATAAQFARVDSGGCERPPTAQEWEDLILHCGLAGPREKPPSPPGAPGPVVYGRVGGVAIGSQWTARLADSDADTARFSIPTCGEAISFPIASVANGTFGTGQVQSAKVVVREPDTAYSAHGNYGIKYDIAIPVVNKTGKAANLQVSLQSPLKKDTGTGLSFLPLDSARVFFRGNVRVSCSQSGGSSFSRLVHIVQHQGQQGKPLIAMVMQPSARAVIHLELIYPPDATPPQVVTIANVKSTD